MNKHTSQKKALHVRIISYLPELLVLLICGAVLLANIHAKQGFHMDELLSFELANAEFNPWIVTTQPQGRLAKFVENELRGESALETFGNLVDTVEDVLKNRGNSKLLSYTADVYEEPVWIDRQTFEDYITVSEKDGFSYLSVYFNVKDDNHPPLHFMVLHTVSSLFRGELTPMMGCVINLVCVLGIMVLLMKLGRLLMKVWGFEEWGRLSGLVAAGGYGLSIGAVSTTLLIRMYAMVTLFCIWILFLHVRKIYSRQLSTSDFQSHNKLLILVTALGFWTQYFFLFYCLILAAVTAALLWMQKRKKELFCYVRAMIVAAIIGVGTFPFAVSDVFSSGRGVEALENLSAGFAGYGNRIGAFAKILFEETGCLWLLLPVVVILAVLVNRKGKTVDGGRGGEGLQGILWIPVVGYFLLAARMSPYLVDRYIMPLFPLVALAVTAVAWKGVGMICAKAQKQQTMKRVVMVLAGVLLCGQFVLVLNDKNEYLYLGYEAQEELAQDYQNYPCICVYQGVGYYENLMEFATYEKSLLLTKEELEKRQETESLTALSEAVLLVKGGIDQNAIGEILKENYGLHVSEVLMDGGAPYGDSLFLVERR